MKGNAILFPASNKLTGLIIQEGVECGHGEVTKQFQVNSWLADLWVGCPMTLRTCHQEDAQHFAGTKEGGLRAPGPWIPVQAAIRTPWTVPAFLGFSTLLA